MSPFAQVFIKNKKDSNQIILGYITWQTKDDFGFEFDICETTASMTCSYSDWEIIERQVKNKIDN